MHGDAARHCTNFNLPQYLTDIEDALDTLEKTQSTIGVPFIVEVIRGVLKPTEPKGITETAALFAQLAASRRGLEDAEYLEDLLDGLDEISSLREKSMDSGKKRAGAGKGKEGKGGG